MHWKTHILDIAIWRNEAAAAAGTQIMNENELSFAIAFRWFTLGIAWNWTLHCTCIFECGHKIHAQAAW